MQQLNNDSIVIIFVTFLFEISGNAFKDKHFLNMQLISFTLDKSHFDKSGKNNKDAHSLKIFFIHFTWCVFHDDIFGISDKDEQLENI